ncbi:MAG: hypothetical protein MK135_03800 [Polyangiaceae bacterium]|nr:hypothetical protein [Polyangiaceae bacterium]
MKNYIKKLAILAGTSIVALAPMASAGQRVMPASGHPYDSRVSNSAYTFDSKVCNGTSSWQLWNTPLVIDTSETSVSVYQTKNSGDAQSRVVSFNSSGTVNSFSGGWTSSSSVGSVNVPSSGTVFIQSRLRISSSTVREGCITSFRAYPN